MSEIGESILASLKKRTTSAVVGTYLFFWLSFHWQGAYTTLFVSEDKIYEKYGLLKNEYVSRYFFSIHGIWDWKYYFTGYLLPLALTVLFVWPLPKYVLIHFYRIEQEHKTERLRIRFLEEQKRRNFEIKDIKEEEARVIAKTSLIKSKNTAAKTDPKIIWEGEYKEFEADPAFDSFAEILESIYEHRGQTRVEASFLEPPFELSGRALLAADTRNLVMIANNGNISLTDKGKYFAAHYPIERKKWIVKSQV